MADPLTGAAAESLACAHLERAGLKLVERNYRCPQGEIDLVMDDRGTLVFVEVRYRRTSAFGSPGESVDWRKQARLLAAARHYLMTRQAERICRFDVIAVSGTETHRIEWLRNAFDAG